MDNNTISSINISRGVLCQYVIVSHLIPAIFPGILGFPGTLAVWSFFVFSGYLNFFSFAKSSSIAEYYAKRIKRLFPLLGFSFFIVAITQKTLLVNDVYTLFPLVINVKDRMPFNGVLWTLILELQLYLLTPLLFHYFQKFSKGINVFSSTIVAWIFAFLSFLGSILFSKLIVGNIDLDDRMLFSAIPFYLFGFLLARIKIIKSKKELRLNKFLSLFLFLLILFERNSLINQILRYDILFSFGRIIPITFATYSIFFSPFNSRLLVWLNPIGKATYEIYLFHGCFCYIHHFYFSKYNDITLILLFYMIIPNFLGILYERYLHNFKIIKFFMLKWSQH